MNWNLKNCKDNSFPKKLIYYQTSKTKFYNSQSQPKYSLRKVGFFLTHELIQIYENIFPKSWKVQNYLKEVLRGKASLEKTVMTNPVTMPLRGWLNKNILYISFVIWKETTSKICGLSILQISSI